MATHYESFIVLKMRLIHLELLPLFTGIALADNGFVDLESANHKGIYNLNKVIDTLAQKQCQGIPIDYDEFWRLIEPFKRLEDNEEDPNVWVNLDLDTQIKVLQILREYTNDPITAESTSFDHECDYVGIKVDLDAIGEYNLQRLRELGVHITIDGNIVLGGHVDR